MGFDFGNIHGMTKADFQAAIEYYQNKIAQMEADESINPGAKAWFLKRYNARLQTLERGFERLQEVINDLRSRTPSVYVNEATATINNLSGTTVNDTTTFSNMRQSKAKYGWGQFFRALGGLVLPVVGTIPFVISAVKARRKYKAVQSAITRENIDMQNFANERRRSYDAALATNTPFTEQEMQELLANPAELQRLTNLTEPTNTTLNPAEKKILASKLAAVRAYAQKNGYTIATGSALDNARFNTSADKIRSNPLAAGPVGASTDLKDAHDKIKTLEGLKTQAEALLAADPENDDLKALVSTIDSNIATLKGQAETFVTGGLTNLNNDLTAAATLNTSLTPEDTKYTDSNTRLDTAYNNKNRFGGTSSMTVAEAKAYAEALGLDVTKFDSAKQKYDNAKNKNNAELQIYNDFKKIYNEVKSIIETYTDDFINSLDNEATTLALAKLNEAKGKLDQLMSILPNIPTTDSRHDNYVDLRNDLSDRKQKVDEHSELFKNSENSYSTLKQIYDDAKAYYTTGSFDKELLKIYIENIENVIAKIKEMPEPRSANFKQLLNDSSVLVSNLKDELSKAEIKDSKLNDFKTTVRDADETKTDKYKVNQAALQSILDTIDNETYKNNFSEITKNEIELLITEIKRKLSIIKAGIEEEKEAKTKTATEAAEKEKLRNSEIATVRKEINELLADYNQKLALFVNDKTKSKDKPALKEALKVIQLKMDNFEDYIDSFDNLTTTDKNHLKSQAHSKFDSIILLDLESILTL